MLAAQTDPHVVSYFFLEIAGVVEARFTEVSGMSVEREVKEYAEGGINDYVHRLPGRVKASNITLKTGFAYSTEIWKWFAEGQYDGKVRRQNISIILADSAGHRIRQWDVTNAFPVKYSTSETKTDATSVSIETLELAHHGVTLVEQKKAA